MLKSCPDQPIDRILHIIMLGLEKFGIVEARHDQPSGRDLAHVINRDGGFARHLANIHRADLVGSCHDVSVCGVCGRLGNIPAAAIGIAGSHSQLLTRTWWHHTGERVNVDSDQAAGIIAAPRHALGDPLLQELGIF